MYYDPREELRPAPLKYNPFNALVAPRPIAWVSSINKRGGVNLAPFSFFNAVSSDPPYVMFAIGSKDVENTPKDTLRNIQEVPEFVVNIATWDLRDEINLTSKVLPYDINEFDEVGLTQVKSSAVQAPRVGEAKAALECIVYQIIELPIKDGGRSRYMVIGEVVGIYIDDKMIEEGKVCSSRLQQLSRLGYFEYDVTTDTFDIPRPK